MVISQNDMIAVLCCGSTTQEKLKPRISRVVRQKFGPKQQALEATTAAQAGESQLEFDEFLSKLYVHLLNESTTVRARGLILAPIALGVKTNIANGISVQVLNAVYRDTVVELEECDVYDAATISEDRETCNQKLAKLLRWARDADSTGEATEAVGHFVIVSRDMLDVADAAIHDRSVRRRSQDSDGPGERCAGRSKQRPGAHSRGRRVDGVGNGTPPIGKRRLT